MLNTLPDLHRSFAEQLKLKLQSDSRIHSLLAGGSFIHGGFDQYSDLDFVVVIDPLYYDEIMAQRMAFAGTLGHLLHAFTGEHVGEPRLLICLFGPELLHVDLKFITSTCSLSALRSLPCYLPVITMLSSDSWQNFARTGRT